MNFNKNIDSWKPSMSLTMKSTVLVTVTIQIYLLFYEFYRMSFMDNNNFAL